MKNLNNFFLIGLIVLTILLSACSKQPEQQPPAQPKPQPPIEDPIPESTFKGSKGNFEGTLTLTGYLEIEHRDCPPDSMCSEDVEYAKFKITDTDNQAIYGFLKDYQGNSYAGENWVGLGCYEKDKNRIYLENFSDDAGSTQNVMILQQLEKLLASTEQKPVQVTLKKPPLAGGSGAPDCYSHFRDPYVR